MQEGPRATSRGPAKTASKAQKDVPRADHHAATPATSHSIMDQQVAYNERLHLGLPPERQMPCMMPGAPKGSTRDPVAALSSRVSAPPESPIAMTTSVPARAMGDQARGLPVSGWWSHGDLTVTRETADLPCLICL